MSYIGSPPKQSFTSGLLDRFTSTTGTTVTLTHDIASENDIVVFVNFVKQDSTTYSVGGTGNKTLTLGGTLVSSDIVEVHYLNIVGQTVAPSSGSVGSSQLTSGAVTGAKLNTDVISAQTELASAPASTDELLVSDAGVLKRVDVSLVGGANTPAFSVRKTGSAQSLSSGSYTKITFNTEDFDTDNAYASDKFTVPSGKAGKYLFNAAVMFENDSASATQYAITAFYKNGTQLGENQLDFRNTYGGYANALSYSLIIDLAESDYVEVYGAMGKQSGTISANYHASRFRTYFQGYKLI